MSWVKQFHESNFRLSEKKFILACSTDLRNSPENIALWFSPFFPQKIRLMKLKRLQIKYVTHIFIHSELGIHVMATKIDIQKVLKTL